jgi:hypothetical protein
MVDLPNGFPSNQQANALAHVMLHDTQHFGVLFYDDELRITDGHAVPARGQAEKA